MSYIEEGPYVSVPIFVLSQFPSLSIQVLACLTTTTKNNFFKKYPPPFPLKKLFDAIKPNMLLLGNIVKNHKNLYNLIHNIYLSLTKVYGQYNYVIHLTFFFAEIRKPAIIGDKVYHVIQISRCNFLFSFDG